MGNYLGKLILVASRGRFLKTGSLRAALDLRSSFLCPSASARVSGRSVYSVFLGFRAGPDTMRIAKHRVSSGFTRQRPRFDRSANARSRAAVARVAYGGSPCSHVRATHV